MVLQIRPLRLRRIILSGLKLGDRGAAEIAGALTRNTYLRDLVLSRCGIGDPGGRALFEAIGSNHHLYAVDVSWNAMRGDTAKAVQGMLCTNLSLQRIDLSRNGFSDLDAARIVKGLMVHGVCCLAVWMRSFLAHTTLLLIAEWVRLCSLAEHPHLLHCLSPSLRLQLPTPVPHPYHLPAHPPTSSCSSLFGTPHPSSRQP